MLISPSIWKSNIDTTAAAAAADDDDDDDSSDDDDEQEETCEDLKNDHVPVNIKKL